MTSILLCLICRLQRFSLFLYAKAHKNQPPVIDRWLVTINAPKALEPLMLGHFLTGYIVL
jgi:hypothetical protein